jgi:hypothetical protein
MVCKLLIEFELTPAEPVSNEDISIKLKLTNIGELIFPGGELTYLALVSPGVTRSARKSSLSKIPSLKQNESIELGPHRFRASESGVAWVQVQLKASEDQKVDLYQNPENNMGQTWQDLIVIKSQEYVMIIKLLEKIVELLKEKKKQ